MKNKKSGGCLAYVVGALAYLAVVIGWAEFFGKLLKHSKENRWSIWDAISDLSNWQTTVYDAPGMGWVFFAVTLLIFAAGTIVVMRPIRMILDYLEISEAPVSILESEIELKFEDDKLENCKVTRKQLLHANHSNVSAYHYKITSHVGKIDKTTVEAESYIDHEKITDKLITSRIGSAIDSVERYKKPLPVNILATYLPDRIVAFLRKDLKLLKKHIVQRTVITKSEGEYCGENPTYQLIALRYPASDIVIYLDFPASTAPDKHDVFSFFIRNHAVTDLTVKSESAGIGRCRYSVNIDKIEQNEFVRVQWKNTKLHSFNQGSS